ncbi:hypothetical protein GTA08_BOTSDO13213 [Neofusicoccum parvum]|uniref:Uncharacterized protein n=1 Tax=Neofusicoccum parvum TaxID=310453 RepID=A0ACB5SF62_9PEZI|nr:hypothetical protein GTA08_BOTSDO13213 [Neofusicoccum parvum]
MGCYLSRAEPESNRKKLSSGNKEAGKDDDEILSKRRRTKQIVQHIMPAGLRKVAAAVQKAKDPSAFPWTDLPGEIKNRIYDLTLSSPTPICIESRDIYLPKPYSNHNKRSNFQDFADEEGTGRYGIFSKQARLVPNLILINRQTYREGARILYHNNLNFLDAVAFNVFMIRHEARESLKWLERITLESLFNTQIGCYLLGIYADNLQSLTLNNLPDHCDTVSAAIQLINNTAVQLWVVGFTGSLVLGYVDPIMLSRSVPRVDLIRLSESSVDRVLTVENGLEPTETEVKNAHQQVEENFQMALKNAIRDEYEDLLRR